MHLIVSALHLIHVNPAMLLELKAMTFYVKKKINWLTNEQSISFKITNENQDLFNDHKMIVYCLRIGLIGFSYLRRHRTFKITNHGIIALI